MAGVVLVSAQERTEADGPLPNRHHGATLVPMTLDRRLYHNGEQAIPAVSASVSKNDEGKFHVTMTNVDPNQPRTVLTEVRGFDVSRVSGRVMAADAMNAHNTFEQSDSVSHEPFAFAELMARLRRIALPPKSIVVLTLD